MDVKSDECRSLDMPKQGSTKVTIDVPNEKYAVLIDIKNITGESIRALVSEGVDLIIEENEDLLDETVKQAAEEATLKADNIKAVLSQIKRKRNSK